MKNFCICIFFFYANFLIKVMPFSISPSCMILKASLFIPVSWAKKGAACLARALAFAHPEQLIIQLSHIGKFLSNLIPGLYQRYKLC